ncbi:MAG: hypothetical protein CL868_20725 [Cytophagaceae bacterium]|nr:hypothetical protein [Cytophagaceae bacterium]|tara:strand:- start:1856 stop:2635 length:780 start_codon:yes stop_codon:yes gene_type:complete
MSSIKEVDANYNILSIQVSLDGFSFLVKNELSQETVFIHNIGLPQQASPQIALVKLEQCFKDVVELQQKFKKVTVVYSNELYTLVPAALFDKDKLTDYLKYSIKLLKDDFIVYDEISQFDLINVYVPYANLNNFFFDRFGSFTYYHGVTLLLQKVLGHNSNGATLAALAKKTSFDLVITKGSDLQLANTFDYQAPEDFAYHILFCIEQLQLDPEKIMLRLYGAIEPDGEIFDLLYKYIRNVELIVEETQNSPTFLLENT